MDVSFISIRLILPAAAAVMGDQGVFYTLIKPQFEAGRENVGKKGVVRDPDIHAQVIERIRDSCEEMNWRMDALDFSPITGPEGNIEFITKILQRDSARRETPLTPEEIRNTVEAAHAFHGARKN